MQFQKLWKVNRDFFNIEMTPVIISMWITDTIRKFQKIILNPSIFTGEPPHTAAQPPLRWQKINSKSLILFSLYLFVLFIVISF